MKKKIISLALALVLMTALLPITVSAVTEIDKEITELAELITTGITSDYEKARAIHSWVASNIWYDYDIADEIRSGKYTPDSQSSKTVLQNKRGTCEGYARLTLDLFLATGIPAEYRFTPFGHAWNEVYIAGRWTILDTSYDSNNYYENGIYSERRDNGIMLFDISPSIYVPFVFGQTGGILRPISSWAMEGVYEAYGKGFVPEELRGSVLLVNFVTRQEFCRMAVKWVEYATGKNIDTILTERGLSRDPNAFTDTSDPDILAAFALGITSGTGGGQFTPNGQFDRQSAATMIMNTCRAIGADVSSPPTSDFADLNTAATWAQNGINYVRANGIMSGDGTNFNPAQLYTREQSIITFNNIRHNELP